MSKNEYPFIGVPETASGGDDIPEGTAVVREAVLSHFITKGSERFQYIFCGMLQRLWPSHRMPHPFQRPDVAADQIDGNRLFEELSRNHGLFHFVSDV